MAPLGVLAAAHHHHGRTMLPDCFEPRVWAGRATLAALALAALTGCAQLGAPARSSATPSASDGAAACQRWFRSLDAATDAHHVRDGGAARVAGFPFVRVNRVLASFRTEALASDPAFNAWGERVRALDASARGAELANLPDAALPDLPAPDKPTADATTQRCADLLWREVLASQAQRAAMAERAQVPDDYTAWKRALGLYPLTRLPFFAGVEGWQNGLRETFAQQANAPTAGAWQRYVPASAAEPADAVQALVKKIPRDALGIPQPDPATVQRLLQAYAPVLDVETKGPSDRPGPLRWGDGPAPAVDTSQPVLTQRVAFTRFGAQTLLQLVYTAWFPERPASGGLDLLAGRIDAVVLRITLGADGAPLLLDTIHACGCYHLFFPTPSLTPRPPPASRTEWAFVPATLPALQPGQRLRVRIASGTHYVVGVAPDGGGVGTLYTLQDDDALRTLPTPQGTTRSAFWPSGLMPGTERGERILFWPMGIDSPGAMRQWGRQPTAFVGRRHFDEARLVEERFELR
jgi:hypothetical protein